MTAPTEDFARATIVGVIRDIRTNTTGTGKVVTNMRIQCGRAGTFSVAAWEKLGEHAQKTLAVGSRIIVSGNLRNSSYEKDGQRIWKVEISASEIENLDPTGAF